MHEQGAVLAGVTVPLVRLFIQHFHPQVHAGGGQVQALRLRHGQAHDAGVVLFDLAVGGAAHLQGGVYRDGRHRDLGRGGGDLRGLLLLLRFLLLLGGGRGHLVRSGLHRGGIGGWRGIGLRRFLGRLRGFRGLFRLGGLFFRRLRGLRRLFRLRRLLGRFLRLGGLFFRRLRGLRLRGLFRRGRGDFRHHGCLLRHALREDVGRQHAEQHRHDAQDGQIPLQLFLHGLSPSLMVRARAFSA